MLSIFGCFSSDVGMKVNRLHKIWGLLAPHLFFWCQVTSTLDTLCRSQPGMRVQYVSAVALHIYFFIYPWDMHGERLLEPLL